MTLSGNKGEWSELYAFFKLLADGVLFCGDAELNRIMDKYYPILEIFRNDNADRLSYKIQSIKKSILIQGESVKIEIPQNAFSENAKALLSIIKNSTGSVRSLEIESFMNKIHCYSIKAKSADKADIRIIIHDLSTGTTPEMGYSIKSKLGGESTLLNANKDGTNFIYTIINFPKDKISNFNSTKYFKDKFKLLRDHNAVIKYHDVFSDKLKSNLTMLDSSIERIIAEELLVYYSGAGKTIAEITENITSKNPLGIINPYNQPIYEYKVKQFLLAFALGMTASKPWNGMFNANGGFIVVKEDGDIVCYHYFDRNDLENYLYYNTKFDTPSTGRHDFGYLYEEDGALKLKLNIQVRFF